MFGSSFLLAAGGPMHTLSSASRTCIASASAVEWTATVAMPSSLQARSMRSAISPRFAIKMLSNMKRRLFDNHQRLAVLDRLTIFHDDLLDRASARRGNLVHRLHRFDDKQRLPFAHCTANLQKAAAPVLSRNMVSRSDHRRANSTTPGWFSRSVRREGPQYRRMRRCARPAPPSLAFWNVGATRTRTLFRPHLQSPVVEEIGEA